MMYRAISRSLPNQAIFLVNDQLEITLTEGQLLESLVPPGETLVGRPMSEVVSDSNRERVLAMYRNAFSGQSAALEIQRGERFYDLKVVPIYQTDAITHAMGLLYDITDRKEEMESLERARVALQKQAEALREASVTDELTGLLNRRGFMLLADQQLKLATRERRRSILLFIDLNGMKTINDNLGHDVGDKALKDTAALLKRVFRSTDVIGRLGGDEFVVFASDDTGVTGRSWRTASARPSPIATRRPPPSTSPSAWGPLP